ncbi:hypothetical protein [Actinoplanes solisilvae]|uniref:hypothetical protein n=1 Tax=Actinoplanes solisilvae TaxID=2486853 RepID=UPI000FDCCE52|nr:hypothetical protein [Actinoplanes solisilvae]
MTAPSSRPAFDPESPVLPAAAGSPMLGSLVKGPIEALPLYAVLTVVHLELSGNIVNACLPVCEQIVGALRHLGFAAETMAAYVEVTKDGRRYGGIGVNGKATVYPDGTTNGHTVVWAESFGRLVDATVAQHPELNRAVHQGSLNQSAPLVLPVGERELLLQGAIGAIRPPYQLAYLALPQHTSVFDGWVASYREPLDYGALSMAHRGLIALEAAGKMRNIRQLAHLYPQLGRLLNGVDQLPELGEPPASIAQLLAIGRQAKTAEGN